MNESTQTSTETDFQIDAVSTGLPHHAWNDRPLRPGETLALSNFTTAENLVGGDPEGVAIEHARAMRGAGWEDVTLTRIVTVTTREPIKL